MPKIKLYLQHIRGGAMALGIPNRGLMYASALQAPAQG